VTYQFKPRIVLIQVKGEEHCFNHACGWRVHHWNADLQMARSVLSVKLNACMRMARSIMHVKLIAGLQMAHSEFAACDSAIFPRVPQLLALLFTHGNYHRPKFPSSVHVTEDLLYKSVFLLLNFHTNSYNSFIL
jgi:hypothetical protein